MLAPVLFTSVGKRKEVTTISSSILSFASSAKVKGVPNEARVNTEVQKIVRERDIILSISASPK